MPLMPKRTKHRKMQKGRMRGKATRGNKVTDGEYGIQAVTGALVTGNQIEAARIAMTRYIKRGGKVWIKIFPDKPITAKPIGTRMGKGKGAPEYWVAVVKPGRVMFEISGVPEETAYALSDGYIQTVEECTSKSSIEKLLQKAALRFAQEVQKSGMRHYSREIEAAVKYIHLHLHVPVTLEETAEAAGISASYLSRLFKKETGMLFVDYIQKERIEAACNMLTYSDYTAAQISEYLCFSTQSYFIKIFRKYTGTTPAKYKKYKI